jgi:hypothetical protein
MIPVLRFKFKCLKRDSLKELSLHFVHVFLQDIEVGKAVRPQLAMRVANAAVHGKGVVCKDLTLLITYVSSVLYHLHPGGL